MSTSFSEAKANAEASLTTNSIECVLYRADLEALLDHIGNLEFEASRLTGTFIVLEER